MQWFIVPDLDGPTTGGTLFNRSLVAALHEQRFPCRVLSIENAASIIARAPADDRFWLDSLYLHALPALASVAAGGARPAVGLLLHYLPSLVTWAGATTEPHMVADEVEALAAASAIVVPSLFMQDVVHGLLADGFAAPPIVHIEPGRTAKRTVPLLDPPIRAVMVANLLPGKGVAPFLRGLARRLQPSDRLRLAIIGGKKLDPGYALQCRELAKNPRLRDRVAFLGELSPDETISQMAASNLFVSASLMESYGMALAEARTLGIPIIATSGGNVRNLVARDFGGEIVDDAPSLAEACVGLVRDPDEHLRRSHVSRTMALPARPWSYAAQEFALAMAELDGLSDGVGRQSSARAIRHAV